MSLAFASLPRKDLRLVPVGSCKRRLDTGLLLLFAFLAALYVLTSGGHTSSNLDEGQVYLAQEFAEFGHRPIPLQEQIDLFGGVGNGVSYSRDHPLTAIAAVPFYWLGSAVALLFDPRFHDFIVRGFIGGLDALATAATAVILALMA